METFYKIYNTISSFDLIYLIFTLFFVTKCFKNGFVLSILSISKWLLAYILTLFLFPKIKPYVKNIIDNQYVLDICLGISIFVLIIFIILLISKAISRAITFSGLGTLDRIFGFFFGFFKAYVVIVCIFTTFDIVYNYKKWPKLILAGGLDPENVSEAIRLVRPWGVDTASGVEMSDQTDESLKSVRPRKDHLKIQDFVQAARRMQST